MLYLTDNPRAAREVLPRLGSWARACSSSLPVHPDLTREVFGDVDVFCSTDCEDTSGRVSRVCLIVEHAKSSQFDLLIEAGRRRLPLPNGLICLALTGRNFRGQSDRSWVAERGNLHMTTFHEVDLPASRVQAALTMLPAVVVAGAIRKLGSARLRPAIKWVNDILIDGLKVAGALTSTRLEAGRVKGVVFGIGLNVSRSPAIETAHGGLFAGCLTELEPELESGLSRLMLSIDRGLREGLDGLEGGARDRIYQDYREASCFLGESVTILSDKERDQPVARGKVIDVLPDLGLRIEGEQDIVYRGRMILAEHAWGPQDRKNCG